MRYTNREEAASHFRQAQLQGTKCVSRYQSIFPSFVSPPHHITSLRYIVHHIIIYCISSSQRTLNAIMKYNPRLLIHLQFDFEVLEELIANEHNDGVYQCELNQALRAMMKTAADSSSQRPPSYFTADQEPMIPFTAKQSDEPLFYDASAATMGTEKHDTPNFDELRSRLNTLVRLSSKSTPMRSTTRPGGRLLDEARVPSIGNDSGYVGSPHSQHPGARQHNFDARMFPDPSLDEQAFSFYRSFIPDGFEMEFKTEPNSILNSTI